MRALRASFAAALVLAGCTASRLNSGNAIAARPSPPTIRIVTEADRRRRVESYYREATELYNETMRVVDHTPATTKAALALSQSQAGGGVLIAREVRFQSEIEDGPHVTTIIDADVRDAQLKLAGFEAFLSQTIHSALQNCNRNDAELNASVVRALLTAARHDLDGHPIANWSPPDISKRTNGADECRV